MAKKTSNRYGKIIVVEKSTPTTICNFCKYSDLHPESMPCNTCAMTIDINQCYEKETITNTK
jgi:hypothetical protein